MNINDYLDYNVKVSAVHLALTKKCPDKWESKIISRASYGLTYISSGGADFIFTDRLCCANADDIVFLRKGDSYVIRSAYDEPLKFTVISFDVENDATLPFSTINKTERSMRLYEMFKYIEDIHFAGGVAHKLYCGSMVEQIIYHLMQEQFYQSKQIQKLRASLNFVENYCDKKITIDNLAEIAGMSVSHYRKIFKEVYGVSPIKYIGKVRIEKAKNMLKSGLYLQTEIAKQCGFENEQYFNRVFKKITGLSPGVY